MATFNLTVVSAEEKYFQVLLKVFRLQGAKVS